MVLPYITLAETGQGEYNEKKSRFLGIAAPIETEEQAAELLAQIKAKHYDARHHCYAYRLLNGTQRYTDDGEPQGTAGQPILELLTHKNLTNCIVIVTRYFGGTLLGTGGLVRSYTAAALSAIDNAPVLTMTPYVTGCFVCSYTLYGRLTPLIARHDGVVQQSDFADQVTLTFWLPQARQTVFEKELCELTAGTCQAEWKDCFYAGSYQGKWLTASMTS